MVHKKLLLCIFSFIYLIRAPIIAMDAPSDAPPQELTELDKALFDAISKKEGLEKIRQLITQGANLNAQPASHDKKTPLLYAISQDSNIDIIKALITPQNINAKEFIGLTPLHEAAHKNNLEVVKLLIQHGAHKNAPDNGGEYPLHDALRVKADIYVIKELITPENINAPLNDAFRRTPLGQALDRQYPDIINLLIESGAEISEQILKDYSGILTAIATQVTPEEVQHIIPGILALKAKSKDMPTTLDPLVRANIKNQMIQDIINEKLALARKYKLTASDKELTDLIWANMKRELSKKTRPDYAY